MSAFFFNGRLESHGYDDVTAAKKAFSEATNAEIIEALSEAAQKFGARPAEGFH